MSGERCARWSLSLLALFAAGLAAPRRARAQACCAAPSLTAPSRLQRDERFGLGLQARGRGVFGGFAADGAFASTSQGDVETAQDLFVAAQAAGRVQLAVVAPFVETRRRAPGLTEWGGGLGDVRASVRAELVRDGRWPHVPGVSLLAGLTLPTGTTPEAAHGPLAADATGTGQWAGSVGVELERRWERTFATLATWLVQRARRTVGPVEQSFGLEVAALATAGRVLWNDAAVGAFVTGSRQGAARDATTGAPLPDSALALVTAGLAATLPPADGWRVQGTLSVDCPVSGLGLNRTAGAGLAVSVLRFWH